jgi:hypothetical protein
MRKFPVTILDNFYENPDLVRQFALSLDSFTDSAGRWPGRRTLPLDEVNYSFFSTFCNKLFNLFYDLDYHSFNYRVSTNFQTISNYSENPISNLNTGWIHSDDEYIFSGVIYLNPNPSENTGTNIYNRINWENSLNLDQSQKHKLYKGEELVNESEYTDQILENNNKFEETVSIKNVYNRMILFEGGVYHGVPSFYSSSSEPRLTQVFFVHKVTGGRYPIVRSKVA